ncbi:MAG TPA: hypothetical protein DET40_17225 [Lentisphaeria bacterium]|nr:MAG: hypothetical protein A2X45_02780 [Lentisphaerae bacterium GWF2_50_93]HCE45284.1 hypothetical protein [Lentisphaeria bacterium]
MEYVQIGKVKASRFILGTNQFSGFSHWSPQTDLEMKRYYTVEKIKQTLREAESLGINTMIGRADNFVIRFLLEYWDQGGRIQWFAQTCSELATHEASIGNAASGGAKACHIHGGVMDYLLAQDKADEIKPAIELIRKKGMLAGIAGHNHKVFEWAEKNLDVDYYMCCYYNASRRDNRAGHVAGMEEIFDNEDRDTMTNLIQVLSKPVIHYKIMGAGRNDPKEAFQYAAKAMRKNDAACVGVYTKDNPDMIRNGVDLLISNLKESGR